MGCSLVLDFYGDSAELVQVVFKCNDEVLRSVRGKTSGAISNAGTFQWSSAVRALSSLLVRHVLAQNDNLEFGLIAGGQGSLASSLDFALFKQPRWLLEMFGTLKNGDSVARRLFLVTNPSRKRPGPVILAVNGNRLSADSILIRCDGASCTDKETLRSLIRAIESLSFVSTEKGENIAR